MQYCASSQQRLREIATEVCEDGIQQLRSSNNNKTISNLNSYGNYIK